MTTFLKKKVMIPRYAVIVFLLLIVVSVTFSILSFTRINQFAQNAEKMAFLKTVDFQGLNYAPINLSQMPASMQMEVAAQLPQSAFVKK
jgi:hypothetical protein